MAVKAISLKYALSGEVDEFLEMELMTCPHTKGGIVELVNQISAYKEEGRALFPEVYITDNVNSITESIIGCELVPIGKSPKSGQIILKALKKCAPLAIGGWNIYILNIGDDFEYGLFRSGSSIVSIPISESLLADGNKESNLILIRQVAEKVVEVRGVKGNTLIINFGIKSTVSLSPLIVQNAFIEHMIKKVDDSIKDQCRIFLTRLFLYVTQNGHGNLSLVIDKAEECPEYLRDGIVLEKKVSFSERILELNKLSNGESGFNLLEANSKLNGVFSIISGMMMSDGITVFSNDGSVCAYNIFLKHPEDDPGLKLVEGGARSRTYYVMTRKLSEGLTAVFIQSQDGQTQTKSYE
jgi:hypothetical protein